METQLAFRSALNQSEALTARQWAMLLGITAKAFQFWRVPVAGRVQVQGGTANLYSFADLPDDRRAELDKKRMEHRCLSLRDLLEVTVAIANRAKVDLRDISSGRWTSIGQFPPDMQALAHLRMKAMHVYYEALERGVLEKNANELAQQTWRHEAKHNLQLADGRLPSPSMLSCCYKKIQRLRQKIDKVGGVAAPIEAYLDGKACRHANARRELPRALVKDFHARITDSRYGVPSVAAIHRDYAAAWDAGYEVPGIGCRIGSQASLPDSAGGLPACPSEPFPITLSQLQRLAPARVVREIAGRGKFAAKTRKLLAAPPLDWSAVEPMRAVMFDDKVLDCMVLTDDGLRAFRPVVYIAYCAGSGRVLAFIAREEGRMTQLDVEGLEAAVLREHGFHEPSIWVRERGTVSMSRPRKEFLERMFHGNLLVHQTMMIGGANALGDWKQAAKGNFFGKGRMEAFMWTLDNLAHTIPAQTGNAYQMQPAMLGDTTLSLETIIRSAKQSKFDPAAAGRESKILVPRHKPSGSLLEESLLIAAMSRVIAFMENGENVSAVEAAMQTGLRPPMLYYRDFVALLGELFRRHNNRRGHAMQGFETVRVPSRKLSAVEAGVSPACEIVTESPNDKASRMLAQMELQGRKITRPSDKDIALLLHKVARVVVKNNGAVVNGIRYFHGASNACKAAVSIAGGQKVFLCLYNPVAPEALYLLLNPPSHLNASATQLPNNFRPQLYEVLPRYHAPDPTNAEAMRERSRAVEEFNAPFARAVAVYAEPRLMEQGEKRRQLNDRLEPLRHTVMSCRPPIAPVQSEASHASDAIQRAEQLFSRPVERPKINISSDDVEAAVSAALPSDSSPEISSEEISDLLSDDPT